MKRVLILTLILVSITAVAHAQATRTWVSGVGDDANPCSRTAPCKTFAGAISKTASPGIINCLDPGGFGAVTITKSIMIDCTGTLGSILSSGVQGVIVNALTTDKIILRNIDISGAGTTLGTNGVNIVQAGSVQLQGVNIETYSGRGVETTNSSNTISVFLDHCDITNVNQQGVLGLATATGATKLTVSNSYISNNGGDGIDLASPNASSAVAYNNIISKNGGVGFQIETSGDNGALESNTISLNATGVNANPGATIRLTRNTIFGSTANGIGGGGGTTKCFGTNMIDGNTGSQTCTSTVPANVNQ
jgi:Right handed beta helix region